MRGSCFRLPRIRALKGFELVAFHVDNPSGSNHGYYRTGWSVRADGSLSYWDPPTPVPGWFGNEGQAGSIAAADIDGDGKPELIVFHIDDPSGGNHGYYRIGRNADLYGHPMNWTDPPIKIPGWFGNESQGGGIAVADMNGDGRPDLVENLELYPIYFVSLHTTKG
jgi:FG-GAP repeat